ncbi:Protein ANTAGONIST OF LIKE HETEROCHROMATIN PROTEIN 1 [Holothuria leucospilota]|uniref:Protein ANTAGONIST OF LIKE HETEROCHROMATIN PROTEIN 1 n=1 Tax=Holothuria leucospilota TaxID=206669 RepID=A0A9Q0YDM2_HOLLE|nr:Protein ANTAGONIST OF LIKE HETEROCHROMATIN PROTEIN 1 [Holothuria leucospilota]
MEVNIAVLASLLVLLSQLRVLLHRRQLTNALLIRRRYLLRAARRRNRFNIGLVRLYLHLLTVAATGIGFDREVLHRSVWVIQRTNAVWDEMILTLTNERWRHHFRINKDTFQFVCDSLRPILQRNRTRFRRPITVEKRVAIALWRMATNVEFRTLSTLFGVGRSTACKITHEVASALRTVFEQEYLQFPEGDALMDIVHGFETRWGFPQVAGAIDGSHIPILAPVDFPNDYYNRKGHHSIVLQAVVDYRYRFTDVFIGWPGSVHDARILSNSDIFMRGQEGTLFPERNRNINGVEVPIMLLGDAAYPLLPWLMKGFSDAGQLTREQQEFNYRLSRARMVVECAFGRLKARWRCLLKRNDSDISKIPTLVFACCILHNICEEMGDPINPVWLEEHEAVGRVAFAANNNRHPGGEAIRRTLVQYFADGH